MKWKFLPSLPLGGAGLVLIVGAAASLLGQFTVVGFEFLAYWRMILGGFLAIFIAFTAIWGLVIAYTVWNGRARWALSGTSRGGFAAGAALLVLLFLCWLEHLEYQCLLVARPALCLAVFAVTLFLQDPIIRPIRQAGRDGIAFMVLLCLQGPMMFLISEVLMLDSYRKGLVHFQEDHQTVFSIPSSARVEFFFDYARKEIVLKAAGSGTVLEHRRFPDLNCFR